MGWGNIVPFPLAGVGHDPHNSQKPRMRRVRPTLSAKLNGRSARQRLQTCVYHCRLAFSFANGRAIFRASCTYCNMCTGGGERIKAVSQVDANPNLADGLVSRERKSSAASCPPSRAAACLSAVAAGVGGCIAANLLVFTNPMASPLALSCHFFRVPSCATDYDLLNYDHPPARLGLSGARPHLQGWGLSI